MTGAERDGALAPGDGEDSAWAGLRARWGEEQAHRALLSAVNDLPGLARLGARYREALERDPDDAAARRGRDEVLRKATVLGMASLPRTAPPPRPSPWVKRALLALLAALSLSGAAWAVLSLLRSGAAR